MEQMKNWLEVRESAIHGRGAFATAQIPRRTVLGHYEGRRYHPGEEIDPQPDGLTYLFALSDGGTIDGAEGGNATRFINHSCAPNCVAVETDGPDDVLVIEIRSLRSIRAGEELFLDYELLFDGAEPDEYRCRCGSEHCRGTMLAPERPGRR